MRLGTLATLGLTSAFAACLFPSVDGLTGAPDASLDAPIEAGPPLDANTEATPPDASADADAAPLPFCIGLSPAPKLCADFDEGLFNAQFSSMSMGKTGTIGGDSLESTSPPTSLLVTVPIGNNDNGGYLSKNFTGQAKTISYAFDVRFDAWVTGGASGVAATLGFEDGHTLSFYVTDTYGALEETNPLADGGNAYLDHRFTAGTIELGKWARVEFDLDLTARTCSAKINTMPALVATAIDSSWPSAGVLSAQLGALYLSSESAPWSVRFDDVVVDWQ